MLLHYLFHLRSCAASASRSGGKGCHCSAHGAPRVTVAIMRMASLIAFLGICLVMAAALRMMGARIAFLQCATNAVADICGKYPWYLLEMNALHASMRFFRLHVVYNAISWMNYSILDLHSPRYCRAITMLGLALGACLLEAVVPRENTDNLDGIIALLIGWFLPSHMLIFPCAEQTDVCLAGEQLQGVAMQADGHAEVVLRDAPDKGRIVANVPNGEIVTVFQQEGESVKVRWKKFEGWAKSCNVQQQSPDASGPHAGGQIQATAPNAAVAAPEILDVGDYQDSRGTVLERLFLDCTIKFINAQWIIAFAETGRILVRCQDLPPEAFVGPGRAVEMLEQCRLVALSYGWHRREHPDPERFTLVRVAKLLKYFLEGTGFYSDFAPLHSAGLFWDFLSLPQVVQDAHGNWLVRRTAEEDRKFQVALSHMQVIYGHSDIRVWRIEEMPAWATPFGERGWPFFERCVATLCNKKKQREIYRSLFDLATEDVVPEVSTFSEVSLRRNDAAVNLLSGEELPPILPEELSSTLRTLHFTGNGDRERVSALYAKIFWTVIPRIEKLKFGRASWGQGQALALANVLPEFTRLQELAFFATSLGCHGAEVIIKAIPAQWFRGRFVLTLFHIRDKPYICMDPLLDVIVTQVRNVGCDQIGSVCIKLTSHDDGFPDFSQSATELFLQSMAHAGAEAVVHWL